MCVPKSEEELGCSFLLSPGKKAGQQECGTVGREARLSKHGEHQPCAELHRGTGKLVPFVSPHFELLNFTSAFHLPHRKVNKIRAAQKESGH